MANVVVVKRLSTGDLMNVTVTSVIKWTTFSEEYLCGRFGLEIGEIVRICRDISEPGYLVGSTVPFHLNDSNKVWLLRAGSSYSLVGKMSRACLSGYH